MAYSACPAPALRETQETSVKTIATVTLTARINELAERFSHFVAARRQRRMLLSLNDQQLLDIGLTRADAEEEYRRSFKLL